MSLTWIIEILRGSKSRDQVKKCLTDGITEGIKFKTKTSEKAAKSFEIHRETGHSYPGYASLQADRSGIDALMKEHEETMKNIAAYEES